jgi:hypothetical protein
MSDMSERSLRMSTLARGVLITYGVALFSWLFSSKLPQAESSGLFAIGLGLGLQVLVLLARVVVKRYEREHGMHGELYPQAMYIVEMIADAITVALFAISTFNAIARFPANI